MNPRQSLGVELAKSNAGISLIQVLRPKDVTILPLYPAGSYIVNHLITSFHLSNSWSLQTSHIKRQES